jgi:MFS family permease
VRRNAVLFVAISVVSGFGSTAMSLVAGVWIFDLSGSSSLAGLAGLCVYAPTLVAPWLGALVDRVERRRLVIRVSLGLGACLLTLWAVRSRAEVGLIFAVMLAYGVSYVVLDAGETALLPAALPDDALGDVNGWRSSAQEGMKLVAPVAGAGLYGAFGGHAVATVGAAMPVAVAALYAAVRLDPRPAEARWPADEGGEAAPRETRPDERAGPGEGRRRELEAATAGSGAVEGVRLLGRDPRIRVPVVLAAVSIAMSGFLGSAVFALVTRLHLPATVLGVLGSAQGAGSIAGGLVAGRVLRRHGPDRVAAAGAVIFATGLLCRCLPWPAALVAASVLIGIGLPWTLIAAVTAVQRYAPDAARGRVAATSTTAMFGPNALAIPLGAAAVHLGGVVPHLMAAALVVAAVVSRRSRRSCPAGSGTGPGR